MRSPPGTPETANIPKTSGAIAGEIIASEIDQLEVITSEFEEEIATRRTEEQAASTKKDEWRALELVDEMRKLIQTEAVQKRLAVSARQKGEAIIQDLTTVFAALQKKIGNLEGENRILKNIKVQPSQPTPPRPTMADIVKLNLPQRKGASAPKIPSSPTKTLFVTPQEVKGSEKESSQQTEKILRAAVNPGSGLQVKKIMHARGGGLMLKVSSSSKVEALTNSEELKNKGIKVEERTGRNPRMMVYDIPQDKTEQDIFKAIYKQNGVDSIMTQQEFCAAIKLCFKAGPKNGEASHWVIEGQPKLRQHLVARRKLYIDWSVCKVKDFTSVRRCYKCQQYGHPAKHCVGKLTCGHCAQEGHKINECQKKKHRLYALHASVSVRKPITK